jgi:cysteine synthase A
MTEPQSSCEPLSDNCRFIQQVRMTPLVPVELNPGDGKIWCKLEFMNPSGSTKDRIARHILEKQWRLGNLKRGDTVVEASSGSTSIALALACAQMGLKFIAVMPASVSSERLLIIRSYGGTIVLTPKAEGVAGAIRRAEKEAQERGSYYTRQFENPDNAEAHRVTTGQEILSQIPGGIVHGVVSGVGTGGTIVGLHKAFLEAGCPLSTFFARPIDGLHHCDVESCSFSSRVPGVVDGMSKLFADAAMVRLKEINVDPDEALETTKRLIGHGFPVGPSSGLNYVAAVEAKKQLGPEANVVTVFPDRMERYFSTELFKVWHAALDEDKVEPVVSRG